MNNRSAENRTLINFGLDAFIDIHTHILPRLDDGCRDIHQSIAFASKYQETGIKRIVATPHYLPGTSWAASKETVLSALRDLQCRLDEEKILLEVLPGMEIAFHRKLRNKLETGKLLSLGNSNHYLIEPAFHGEQDELVAELSHLSRNGYFLILAHPERVEAFQNKPELLTGLVDSGVKIQVNAGSILGKFGQTCKHTALKLNQLRCLHFIASDGHDPVRRPPLSREEWSEIFRFKEGLDVFNRCIANTKEIFAI